MIQLQGMMAGTSLPDTTPTTNVPKFDITLLDFVAGAIASAIMLFPIERVS